jgi:hypothetical protein
MKKILSSLVVLLASSVALAYPTVGDFASLQGTLTMLGSESPFTLDRTIKSFDGANYLVNVQQIIGLEVQSEDQSTPAADMMSREMVQAILADCVAQGGRLETITVAAGSFNACALPFNDEETHGVVWIADVVFGLAKITTTAHDNSYSFTLGLAKQTPGM